MRRCEKKGLNWLALRLERRRGLHDHTRSTAVCLGTVGAYLSERAAACHHHRSTTVQLNDVTVRRVRLVVQHTLALEPGVACNSTATLPS